MANKRHQTLAQRVITAALVAALALDGVPAPAFAEAIAETNAREAITLGTQNNEDFAPTDTESYEIDFADGIELADENVATNEQPQMDEQPQTDATNQAGEQAQTDGQAPADQAPANEQAQPSDQAQANEQLGDHASADATANTDDNNDSTDERAELDALVANAASDVRAQATATAGDEQVSEEMLVSLVYQRFAKLDIADANAENTDDARAALEGKESSAKGITRATTLVLRELGFEVVEVASENDITTWNMVRLANGAWYHVDAVAAARDRIAKRNAGTTGEGTTEIETTAVTEAEDAAEQATNPETNASDETAATKDGANVAENATTQATNPETNASANEITNAWLLRSDAAIAQADETRAPWHVMEPADAELPIAENDFFASKDAEQAPAESSETTSAEEAPAQAPTEEATDGQASPEGAGAENTDEQAPAKEPAAAKTSDAEKAPEAEAAKAQEPKQADRNATSALNSTTAKQNLNSAECTASCKNQTYTGKAIKPSPTVKVAGRTLKLNTDYTPSYPSKDYVNVGKKTIVIAGKGSFQGKRTISFSIVSRSINNASVSNIANQPYTGKAIQPKPTVKVAGRTLKLNTDYTLSYKNNVTVGTATAIIKGKGNYTGSVNKAFNIIGIAMSLSVCRKSISKAKVTGCKSSYTYTGKAIKPSVKVKYGNTTLKKGTHYTVSYGANKKVGKGTITIKGKGKYYGSKKISFKIVKRSVSNASISNIPNKTYTGKAIKPKPTVKVAGRTLKLNTDYTLSYKNNKNAGTATVVVKGKGNYKGSKNKNFKIVRSSSNSFFKIKRDTWNFENPEVSTPLNFCTDFYGIVQGSALYTNQQLFIPAGQCYGMAATVGAIRKYSYPSATSYRSGSTRATNLYQVGKSWTSTSNNLTALDYVRYGQIAQFETSLNQEMAKNEGKAGLGRLVQAVRSASTGTGQPVVIGILGKNGGHAILPMKVTANTTSYTTMSIYDSNHPQQAQTLKLMKSGGSYTGKYWYSANHWGLDQITWGTPCDYLDDLFASTHKPVGGIPFLNSSRYTLYSLSTDMKATIGGIEYDLSKDANYTDDLVIPVNNFDGSFDDQGNRLFWIRDDAGEVSFTDIPEDANITVAAKTGGIEAKVEAGSEVAVNVENFDDNTVQVAGDEGDEFSVRFFEDNHRGGLEEVTVSGTVDEGETVEAAQAGSDIAVTGAEDVVEQ
ncbi:MAG: hypothetical protein IKG21_09520 [Atopobiaceae bacterium]|nr:hypothetical protein [Atopobiaceae bacterium]